MIRNTLALTAAIFFIGLGLFVTGYKILALEFPALPQQNFQSWYVELNLILKPEQISKTDKAVELSVFLPQDTKRFAVVDEQIIANNFGQNIDIQNNQRVLKLTRRNLNTVEPIYIRTTLYTLDSGSLITLPPLYKPSVFNKNNRMVTNDGQILSVYETADFFLDEANERSSDVLSFTQELDKLFSRYQDKVNFLVTSVETVVTRDDLFTEILRANGVDAQIVNGVHLKNDTNRSDVFKYIAIWESSGQKLYSLDASDYVMRDDFFPWWYGTAPIAQTNTKTQPEMRISLKGNQDNALTRALWNSDQKGGFFRSIALQNLPLNQQIVLQILLLLPLGALIISFLRQVIGIKTFGTFMPVLVAVAFRETGLGYGLLFFITVIAVGLFLRSYLSKLHLLSVPRLSAVLTIIILFIALSMIVLDDLDISFGLSIALFPVVILTMFVERMSTVLEEVGAKEALIGGIGSFFAACVIYSLILRDVVQHFMLTFPEVLFIVLGFNILLGIYTGYRLSEYWRFRHMVKSAKSETKVSS